MVIVFRIAWIVQCFLHAIAVAPRSSLIMFIKLAGLWCR